MATSSTTYCPAAFIGEFDALDGPVIQYAFEYFGYTNTHAQHYSHAVAQMIAFVSGDALLGRNVAGGSLHPDYAQYMRSVAARVLRSNESGQETVIFQESGCPCVGSFSFSLPDILARGERRRFCVVFTHPSYDALVSRWPLLSLCARILISDWTAATAERHKEEYSTMTDLERRREEARRCPLRSLMDLLSPSGHLSQLSEEDSVEDRKDEETAHGRIAFCRVHSFFEVALPLVFSDQYSLRMAAPLPSSSSSKQDVDKLQLSQLRQALNERFPLAKSSAEWVNLDRCLPNGGGLEDNDSMHVPRFALNLLLPDTELIARPLAVWLLQYLRQPRHSSQPIRVDTAAIASATSLLNALLSGDQIIIASTTSAREAAGLALALSYVLPATLASSAACTMLADEYVMPYRSRIVSFSEVFTARYQVVDRRGEPKISDGDSNGRAQLVLSELDTEEHVVYVEVTQDRIMKILQSGTQATHSPIGPAREENGETASATSLFPPPMRQTSTLVSRIMGLITAAAAAPGPSPRCATMRLLVAQLDQLVGEYVMRGRVYRALFREQEIRANSAVLGIGQTGKQKMETASFGALFSGRSNSSHPVVQEDKRIEKRQSLSREGGKAFVQGPLLYLHSLSQDHDVLTYLGSA